MLLDPKRTVAELKELRSLTAIVALIVAILPNLPGFLATVKIVDPSSVPAFFVRLYDYAWFVGFAIAFVVYLALRSLQSKSSPRT